MLALIVNVVHSSPTRTETLPVGGAHLHLVEARGPAAAAPDQGRRPVQVCEEWAILMMIGKCGHCWSTSFLSYL